MRCILPETLQGALRSEPWMWTASSCFLRCSFQLLYLHTWPDSASWYPTLLPVNQTAAESSRWALSWVADAQQCVAQGVLLFKTAYLQCVLAVHVCFVLLSVCSLLAVCLHSRHTLPSQAPLLGWRTAPGALFLSAARWWRQTEGSNPCFDAPRQSPAGCCKHTDISMKSRKIL